MSNLDKRLTALEQHKQSPADLWHNAPPLPQSTLDKLAEYERDMSDETRAFIAMMERDEKSRLSELTRYQQKSG